MPTSKKVLMVLTSHDKLGNTNEKTGYYLPEAAHPYGHFKDAGLEIEFASPLGGIAPLDQSSIDLSDALNKSFMEGEGKKMADNTKKLSDCKVADYDCVVFVGGFGTMWDFPDNKDVQRLAVGIFEKGGITAAVCHGPIALINCKLSSGEYLVHNQQVTGFTNGEEDAVQRRDVVPYTCEDKLILSGGDFKDGGVFQANVCIGRSGRLITGQNPPSASVMAEAIVKALKL